MNGNLKQNLKWKVEPKIALKANKVSVIWFYEIMKFILFQSDIWTQSKDFAFYVLSNFDQWLEIKWEYLQYNQIPQMSVLLAGLNS